MAHVTKNSLPTKEEAFGCPWSMEAVKSLDLSSKYPIPSILGIKYNYNKNMLMDAQYEWKLHSLSWPMSLHRRF